MLMCCYVQDLAAIPAPESKVSMGCRVTSKLRQKHSVGGRRSVRQKRKLPARYVLWGNPHRFCCGTSSALRSILNILVLWSVSLLPEVRMLELVWWFLTHRFRCGTGAASEILLYSGSVICGFAALRWECLSLSYGFLHLTCWKEVRPFAGISSEGNRDKYWVGYSLLMGQVVRRGISYLIRELRSFCNCVGLVGHLLVLIVMPLGFMDSMMFLAIVGFQSGFRFWFCVEFLEGNVPDLIMGAGFDKEPVQQD